MTFDRPYAFESVRPEYFAGTWDYALGTPAQNHPRYDEAVKLAEAGGWSPWWIRAWGDVEATLQGCHFDFEAGKRVCDFLEMLVLSQGKFDGKRLKLVDWQRWDLIMPLYGWIRENGTRRYTQGGVWIPKKNGKSGLAAGLALYHLIADGEGAPLVWVAARDREQAKIVYNEASRIVEKTSGLSEILYTVPSRKTIKCSANDGEFFAMSADVKQKEGINWSFGIFDELHVGTRDMWSTLAGGAIARENPLKLSISTAGEYDPTSIGWEQWEYCDKVLSGAITDTSFFALRYCADDDLEWDDPVNIKRANPSLGVIQIEERMQERVNEALNKAEKKAPFLRYHLNVWVNASCAWMDQKKWADCKGEFSEDDLLGRECYAGLDLSDTNDMTSLSLYFAGESSPVLTWCWLPADTIDDLDREHGLGGLYREWVRQGRLRLTSGERINHGEILRDIKEIFTRFNVQFMGYDPYNASDITNDLKSDFGEEFCVEVRQGFLTMGIATRLLENDICDKKLQHDGNPISDWQFSNCSLVYQKAGIYMLTKVSGKRRKKIDAIVSIAIAKYIAHKLGSNVASSTEVVYI